MATGNSHEFHQHPLVEALIPDPAQPPPSMTVLVGYLGNGTSPVVKRLYVSDQLDEWLEFPTEAILYRRDLPGDVGTQVWVPQATSLERHSRTAESVEARFLSGGIADEFGLGRQQFELGQAVSGLRSHTAWISCSTEFGPRCPTGPIGCPTNVLRCRTRPGECL